MKKNVKFKDRFNYKFDNFMSKGGFSIFVALLFLFAIAFIAMSIIRFVLYLIFPDETIGNLSDQLWRVFLQISDAGAVAEDGDSSFLNKLIGIVTIMLGLVLFSSLVAYITSLFETKLDELKKGKSRVIENNHTLILGFGDRVLEIIRELIIADESEKDAAIVVLAQEDKNEMDDFFREKIDELKNTRIITRSGVISNIQTLNKVSISDAKSVVILNTAETDDEEHVKELADARVLKTIIAVLSCTGEEFLPPIIAELHMYHMRTLARKISPQITVIDEHTILAKIMVQTARISGLSIIYDNLVGFDGCEFYFYKPKEGWKEKTYAELQMYFGTSSLVGCSDDHGRILINPPKDLVFQSGYEALLIAEDDSTIQFLKEPVATSALDAKPLEPMPKQIERELIIGWSKKTPIIVNEFSEYLVKGSVIDVLVQNDDESIRNQFDSIKNAHPELSINLICGDIHEELFLNQLQAEKYNNLIILKQDGGDSELRDSETIATLLEFRHYFKSLENLDVRPQLVSEIADSENLAVIQNVGVKDFLISNKFVSKMYAQVSENSSILGVYDILFSEEGSEIYQKPVSLFMDTIPEEIQFADLCSAALNRNETCIGVRVIDEEANPEQNYGIHINPPKSAVFNLTAGDYLITLAEDDG